MASTWIRLIICAISLRTVYTALCGNSYFGENKPRDKDNDVDAETDFGYMMNDPDFIVDCCGTVDKWTANYDSVTGTPTIYFQVWRPTTGNSYELVGQNAQTVAGDGEYTYSIVQGSRITIKSDDRFGWWVSGATIVTHKNGGGEDDDNYMMTLSAASEGDVVDWSGATIENDRSYGIKMEVVTNNAPVIDNLNGAVTVSNALGSGEPIFTLTVSDVDTYDVASLSVAMSTTALDYAFDSSTLIVTTSASLSGPGRTETLTFTVTDQCSNTDSGTLTITITNDPPVIENLPATNSISEDETVETLLITLNVTDTDSTSITCTDVTTPTTYPFLVKQIPATSNYGIYSQTSPNFDYNTQNQYDLTVECDDNDLSTTGAFTVFLVKNAAPIIVNLQNSTSVSTSTPIGTTAFTVVVTDAENDGITYSMTCDVPTCPFEIFNSGEIQVNKDLTNHTIVGYNMDITVTDGKNTVGPALLTITIADINDPVTITNLPISTSVTENTAIGTPVYTVSFSDVDTSQNHVFSMTSSPATGLSYFSIDSSTGEIDTSSLINYEVLFGLGTTTFTFSVTVSDPVSSDTQDLTIIIVDENEAPAFSPSSYTISTTEGLAGEVVGTPSLVATDPDTGESQTFTMDCGSQNGYFYMHSTTGEVKYQSDYDLDGSSTLPTTVTCVVTVTDAAGLTDTAQLTITITDINDNAPIFSPVVYSFYVSYYAQAGTNVGTVTATDADTGTFGTFTYTLNQTYLGVEHFTIDSNGLISVKVTPQGSVMGYSTSVTIKAVASDTGGSVDTADVIIVVSDTTTTSTTTTTDRYRSFMEDSKNIAWLTAVGVLGLAALGAVTYVVYTCKGKQGCEQFYRKFCNQRSSRRFKMRRRRDSVDFSRFGTPSPRHARQPDIRLPSYDSHTVRPPPPPIESQAWRASKIR